MTARRCLSAAVERRPRPRLVGTVSRSPHQRRSCRGQSPAALIWAGATDTTIVAAPLTGQTRASVRYATEAIRAATIVLACVPIMCVYPFLQKYFVKGMRVGSVKG